MLPVMLEWIDSPRKRRRLLYASEAGLSIVTVLALLGMVNANWALPWMFACLLLC